MTKPEPLTLPDHLHKQALASLKAFSTEHFDETLSDLTATLLLDHIVSDLGPAIYNQALADARAYFDERAADLDATLHRDEFPHSTRRKR